jgi:hypothetical protein
VVISASGKRHADDLYHQSSKAIFSADAAQQPLAAGGGGEMAGRRG